MGTPYIPDRGDVVWIDFSPQVGHEQSGMRPAVVISPKSYNQKIGLAILCPVTSQVKGYPFEVSIPQTEGVGGVVLCDQVKSLDWKTRRVKFLCHLPDSVTHEVLKKMGPLVSVE